MIMGTRSGDLDLGMLIYLMLEKGLDAARLEDMVDHRAGLPGSSEVGGDMRRRHEQAAPSKAQGHFGQRAIGARGTVSVRRSAVGSGAQEEANDSHFATR